MDSTKSNDCPIPCIYHSHYNDLYRCLHGKSGNGWDDNEYVNQVWCKNWIQSSFVKKDDKKARIPRKQSPRVAGINSIETNQASNPI